MRGFTRGVCRTWRECNPKTAPAMSSGVADFKTIKSDSIDGVN